MDRRLERYHRIVRESPTEVVEPPAGLSQAIEQMAKDKRRPRTAIARWVSKQWAELHYERIQGQPLPLASAALGMVQKESTERPTHFPSHFGLGLIPSTLSIGGYRQDKTYTSCYTSLSVPRPFDPTLHGTIAGTVGFGYMGYQGNPDPAQHDITTRRGGGPRGGFSWTTGPTEGNYPTGVLPQPTFNLGILGFSNGGWNPEGLQWTNRPKQVRLQGLRNNSVHRVMFARSRKVMFRNLYGPVSEDEATPKAPNVLINGTKPISGITNLRIKRRYNAPAEATIDINSVAGRRSGQIKLGDTVQVFASPRQWDNPPLIFTGFVSDIEEDSTRVSIICLDALGYLTKEVLLTNPTYQETDAGVVCRDIIAGSSYGPPLGKISTQTRVILPSSLNLSGKSRLDAIQTILDIVNNTPNQVILQAEVNGYINLVRLREVDDASLKPYIAGRLPKTAVPQDLYPTQITRDEGDLDFVNKVTVKNSELGITVTEPTTNPQNPVHIIVEETAATDAPTAKFFAQQILNQQGRAGSRWNVQALPERFDIMPGQIVEFASTDGGLAGRQRVFDVSIEYAPGTATMMLTVGRQAPDLVSMLRYATGVSQ